MEQYSQAMNATIEITALSPAEVGGTLRSAQVQRAAMAPSAPQRKMDAPSA